MDNTRFTSEIMEQPSALRSVAGYYLSGEGQNTLNRAVEIIRKAGKLIFTGMGTSRHVAFSVLNKIVSEVPSCEIWDAGELLHFGLETVHDDTVVLAISQSGESAETRAVVKALSGKNTVIGLVNNMDSTIGNYAGITLNLKSGEEATISTKTYTNTLAALQLIADGISGIPIETTTSIFLETADLMQSSIEESAGQAECAAGFFQGIKSLHIIARGHDLTTAEQLSLILKEGACVPGQGMSTGLFRHGPVEMSGPDLAVACIVSGDTKPEFTIRLSEELSNLGSRILLVGDRKYESNLEQIVIRTPSPGIFPIACAPFIELFVHEMAKQRGRTAGVFSHAVKVTNRE